MNPDHQLPEPLNLLCALELRRKLSVPLQLAVIG
jgi:hypothetical protein